MQKDQLSRQVGREAARVDDRVIRGHAQTGRVAHHANVALHRAILDVHVKSDPLTHSHLTQVNRRCQLLLPVQRVWIESD